MNKNSKRIMGAVLVLLVLTLSIIGISKISKIDFNKGKVKIAKAYVEKMTSRLSANVYDASETNRTISNGYDEIKYQVKYSLTKDDNVTERPVIIKAYLDSDEQYARFKNITKTGVVSNLSNDGRTIEARVENSSTENENILNLILLINGAPNGYKVTPRIEIKEISQENFSNVITKGIEVKTNSITGVVRNEDNNPVSDILVSIIKNGEIVRETYTKEDGSYVFSDLEQGKYKIIVNEEIYEQVYTEEIELDNTAICNIAVNQVKPYNIVTHKYITKLKLINNGVEYKYEYGELSQVIQSLRTVKNLTGEVYYKIKIENTGGKAGTITLIKDELPEGLSFKSNKNKDWEELNGVLYNRSLEGESLGKDETREIELILDINNTNQAKTYLNKVTTYGDVYEKVVYILNDKVYKEEDVVEGEVLKEPTVNNGLFSGWYTDKNYTNKYNFKNQVTKDLILYGIINNQYRVEYYDKTDDDYTLIKTETVKANETVKETPIVSKPRYKFLHWSLEKNGDKFNLDTKINSNITLYAVYSRNTNNVKFYDLDPDGEAEPVLLETQIVLQGLSATEPTNIPNHTGYEYEYFKTEDGTEWNFDDPIEEDLTLFTKYKKLKYNVEYYDGTELKDTQVYEYKDLIDTSRSPILTKDGYIFSYWSLKNSKTAYDFTTPVTSNVKLYSNYTTGVIFNDEGYITEVDEIEIGELITPISERGKTGHRFLYWSTDRTNAYSFETTPITGPTTFYAVYTPLEYTVTFNDKNPATDEVSLYDTKTVTYNNPVSRPENNPTNPTGYIFDKWVDENNQAFDFDTPITGDLTLVSSYKTEEYDINYILNDGIVTTANPTKYTIETETFTLNNPTKEGYLFTGWSGTGLEGNENTEVTISKGSTGDREYTANYIKNEFTVIFMDKGVHLTDKDETVSYGEKATKPAEDPTYQYELFKYWSLEENGESYDFDTPVINNIILYSVYEEVLAPNISHTPTNWTNQNVTVSFETLDDYSYRYKKSDDEYRLYNGTFEVEENGTVLGYGIKNGVFSRTTTHEITNIDKVPPTVDEVFIDTILENGFTLGFLANDDLSGVNKVRLRIKNNTEGTSYQYVSDVIYDDSTNVMSYDFDNLIENDSYTIELVAYDKAGNTSDPYEFNYTVEPYTNIVARIVNIGGVQLESQNYINYDSLRGAIEDEHCVSTSCEIQMVKGTNESVEILNGQNITIDINGKTISGIKEDYTIENLGSLTVLDKGINKGVIVNSTGIAIKGIEGSTFTLGDTESALSKESPYIFGKTYGVYNAPDTFFNFYDGKIEGKRAIQGIPTGVRYSYNIHNENRNGNIVATLERVVDPEAIIDQKYYSRLTNAVSESISGYSTDSSDTETPLLDSFDTMGLYGFEYDEENKELYSTNNIVGTTARTSLTIDLSDYSVDQSLNITGYLDGNGYSSIIVKENDKNGTNAEGYNNDTVYTGIFNNNEKTIMYHLEKGKKYYVEISYRAIRTEDEDIDNNTTDSKLIINKAVLIPYEAEFVDKNSQTITPSIKYYTFEYDDETGELKSTNQYVPWSYAYLPVEIDLTQSANPKDIIVNASLDNYSNNFYAYIALSESKDVIFDTSNYSDYYNKRDVLLGYLYGYRNAFDNYGPYNFTKTVDPGKKYYLHFYYIKTSTNMPSKEEYIENGSKDQFIINSIDVVDSVTETPLDTSNIVTSTCTGDRTYKYLPIDLTNSTSPKTLRFNASSSNSNTVVFVKNDINDNYCPQVGNVKDPIIDARNVGSYSSSRGYYYANLEPGKVNYVFFTSEGSDLNISDLYLVDSKTVDLKNLKSTTGNEYVSYEEKSDHDYSYPYYLLETNNESSPSDSYIKLDLRNEIYDQYLKINAYIYNNKETYFYITNSTEAIPFDELNNNPSVLLGYEGNNIDYYRYTKYSTYAQSPSSAFFEYNYKLSQGKVYYLHFAEGISTYENLKISNISLSPIGESKFDGTKISRELITSTDATSTNIDAPNLTDDSFRYIGANPDNFVEFNGETWRIVGVFETEDENGNKANRLKIVREDYLGSNSYDSSRQQNNNGSGAINEWSISALMKLLNPGYESEESGSLYYNSESGTYGASALTSDPGVSVDYTSTGMPSALKPFIDEVVWHTGAYTNDTGSYDDFYQQERGNAIGRNDNINPYIDDTERTTTWVGKVGLPFPTDVLYSADGCTYTTYYPETTEVTVTREECITNKDTSCVNNASWLATHSPMWSMNAYRSNYGAVVFNANGTYNMPSNQTSPNVKPTVYLSTKTIVGGGDGSETNPFTLTLGSSDNPDPDYGLIEKNNPNFISEHGYRYIGSDPNNYVSIGGELWRIIGVFDVEDKNGVSAPRIKLVRKDSIGMLKWDIEHLSTTNEGQGINEWSQADLMMTLNPGYEDHKDFIFGYNGSVSFQEYNYMNNSLYWNRTSGKCTNDNYNMHYNCDYSSTGLTETSRNMIDKVKWYTGSINESPEDITVHDLYNLERSNATGKDGITNYQYLDNVERKSTWYGYVGLLYPSDVYMASSDNSNKTREQCLSSVSGSSDCMINGNWMHNNGNVPFFTLNPTNGKFTYSFAGLSPSNVTTFWGSTYAIRASYPYLVRPTVYLKTNTYIVSGKGTRNNPYRLTLGDEPNPDEYYGLFTNYANNPDTSTEDYMDVEPYEDNIYGFDYDSEANVYTNNNTENGTLAIKTIKYDLRYATEPLIKKLNYVMTGTSYEYRNNKSYYSSIHYYLFEDEYPNMSYMNTNYSDICSVNLGYDKCSSMQRAGRTSYDSSSNYPSERILTLEPGHVYYLQMAFIKNTDAEMTFSINDIMDTESTTEDFNKYVVVNSMNEETDTIVLLRNVTLNSPIEIEGDHKVVIDLNGYNISSSSYSTVINNKGDLTLINTKPNSTSNIYNINNNYGGSLTLNNVEVNNLYNYGDFTGEEGSTISYFYNYETGNMHDGSSTITSLVLQTDEEDEFSGYKVTDTLYAYNIADIDSLNANTSYKPDIYAYGVFTLTNSNVGDIHVGDYSNPAEVTIENVTANNYNIEYTNEDVGKSTSNIDGLTLTGTMDLNMGNSHKVYNSTIPTLIVRSDLYMEDSEVNTSTFYKGNIVLKNSTFTGETTINDSLEYNDRYDVNVSYDSSTVGSISISHGSLTASDSQIASITQQTLSSTYYRNDINLSDVTVNGNITLYRAYGEFNNTSADTLRLSTGELLVNNSTFRIVNSEQTRLSPYSYYTYKGANITFNNLTINNGYISNQNYMTINGATITKGSGNSQYGIKNFKGAYWNELDRRNGSDYYFNYVNEVVEPSLTLTGNITFNGYDVAIETSKNVSNNVDKTNNIGTITLGNKDNTNDTSLTINGSQVGISLIGYGGEDINFYDGTISGASAKAITGDRRFNEIENGYDIKISSDNGRETISLVKISDVTEGAVAKIGSTTYSTLTAAFNAVPDNVDTTIELLEDIVTAATITVPETKNITLDYHGHTINFLGSNEFINNNGTLHIVDNGNSVNTSYTWSKKLFLNNGTLTYDNVNYSGYIPSDFTTSSNYASGIYYITPSYSGTKTKYLSPKIIVNNGTATIDGGQMIGGGLESVIQNNNDSTMTINNGTIKSVSNDGTLYVHGGTFNSKIKESTNYYDTIFRNTGTLVVDGGTYTTTDTTNVYQNNTKSPIEIVGLFVNNTGTATISNVTYNYSNFGENSGTMTLSNNELIKGTINNTGNLVINGGTHKGKITTSNDLTINDIDLETTTDAIVATGADIDIISGTIKSSGKAINCLEGICSTTIGIKGDGITSQSNPDIRGTNFVYTETRVESKVYFYDGILYGSFNASFDEIEDNYSLHEDTQNQIRFLENGPVVRNETKYAVASNPEDYEYETLQAAIDAADEDDKLIMLRNYVKVATDPTIEIGSTKKLSLELDGKNITGSGTIIHNEGYIGISNNYNSDSNLGRIENDGTMSVSGSYNYSTIFEPIYGTIVQNNENATLYLNVIDLVVPNGGAEDVINCSTYPVPIVNEGTMYLNSDTLTSGLGCQIINNSGTLSMNSGSITQNYGTKYYHYANNKKRSVPSNTSNDGISSSLINNTGSMTLNGITITRTGTLYENLENYMYHSLINNTGDLGIYGGTYTSEKDVIITTTGTLNANGVTFNTNKNAIRYSGTVVNNSCNANTNQEAFYALDDNGSLTINNGTFNVVGKDTFELYRGNNVAQNVTMYYPLSNQKNSTVLVKGSPTLTNTNSGVFYGDGGETSNITITSGTATSNGTNSTVINNIKTVTLGTDDESAFSNSPSLTSNGVVISRADTINFFDGILTGAGDNLTISAGVTTIQKPSGYNIVGDNNSLFITTMPFVVNSRTNVPYSNVETAISEAENGDTLRFIKDVYLDTSLTIPADKTLIIDLNGHIVQRYVNNYGDLTVIDSSRSDGHGSYNVSDSVKGFIENLYNYGVLRVNSGRIDLIANASSATSAEVNTAYIYNTWNYKPMTLNGTSHYVFYNYDGNLIVNNSTFEILKNESGSNIQINSGTVKVLENNDGTITINNGTYSSSNDTYSITNKDTMTIENGTFGGMHGVKNEGTLTINGGSFIAPTILFNNTGTMTVSDTSISTSGRLLNTGTFNLVNSSYNNTKSLGVNCESVYDYSYNINREECNKNGTFTINNSSISDLYSNNLTGTSGSAFGKIATNSANITNSTINGVVNVNSGTLNGNTINGETSLYGVDLINNTINGKMIFYNGDDDNYEFSNNTVNGPIRLDNRNSDYIELDNNTITDTIDIYYGKVRILSGTIDTTNDYAITINYNGILDIGKDDSVISTTSPSIKGKVGVKATNGTVNFYDGIIISDIDKYPIEGNNYTTPEGYDLSIINYAGEGVKKTTLGIKGQEEAKIATIGIMEFPSIYDAVDYSAANGGLDIVIHADITLDKDLLVDEDVQITIYLNGHDILNPNNYEISNKINVSTDVVDTSLGASISSIFANILGNDNTKDVIVYEMNDGSKLSPERTYNLYKNENGNYVIVKMKKELELGRYTKGNSIVDMRTVRSRIYLNGLTAGDYKLVDDKGLELNFVISDSSVSSNIKEQVDTGTFGKVISTAVAELIISIQTGGYITKIFILLILIIVIIALLYITKRRKLRN